MRLPAFLNLERFHDARWLADAVTLIRADGDAVDDDDLDELDDEDEEDEEDTDEEDEEDGDEDEIDDDELDEDDETNQQASNEETDADGFAQKCLRQCKTGMERDADPADYADPAHDA